MATKIGQQFEQPALFSREESGIQGSPATQSPEEFRDDPQTVFHASYAKFPTRKDQEYPSEFAGLHAGTYQAAAERALSYGAHYRLGEGNGKRADGKPVDQHLWYDPTAKIVFHPLSLKGSHMPEWPTEGSVGNPTSDTHANLHSTVASIGDSALVYHNDAEDIGNPSVVWGARPRNIQQSDWVQDAVRENQEAGRRPDYGIHPRTYAMLNKQQLDNYDQKSYSEISNLVSSASKHATSHDLGLFPYSVTEWEKDGQRIYAPESRLASREEVHGMANLAAESGDSSMYDPYADRRPGAIGYDHRNRVARVANALSSSARVEADFPSYRNERINDLGDIRRGKQFGGPHG